ncbi:MAG TPA: hypothetical protein VG826_13645 [Pirellulales bacterium]|nr:hypothetical protein [Pirellulales bacterium]
MDHELEQIQQRLKELRAEHAELCQKNQRLREHLSSAIANLGAAMSAIANNKAISEDRRRSRP